MTFWPFGSTEGVEQEGAQKRQPFEQAPEVVTGGGDDDVGRVAGGIGEVVSAHAVIGLQMPDDRLDGGTASQFAFDLFGDAPSLARDEHPELVRFRRIVTAIAAISDDALDRGADLSLHLWDHNGQRVTVIGRARQRLHMRHELTALRGVQRRRHRNLDAELVGAMRLALADAFDLGRM